MVMAGVMGGGSTRQLFGGARREGEVNRMAHESFKGRRVEKTTLPKTHGRKPIRVVESPMHVANEMAERIAREAHRLSILVSKGIYVYENPTPGRGPKMIAVIPLARELIGVLAESQKAFREHVSRIRPLFGRMDDEFRSIRRIMFNFYLAKRSLLAMIRGVRKVGERSALLREMAAVCRIFETGGALLSSYDWNPEMRRAIEEIIGLESKMQQEISAGLR